MPTPLKKLSRKERDREYKRIRRREARRAARADPYSRKAGPSSTKYVQQAQLLDSAHDISNMRIARSGYVGTRVNAEAKTSTVAELLQDGFTYVPWDGKTPHVLLDVHGRIVGVLAGHPEGSSWSSVAKAASAALEDARRKCNIDNDYHRRGDFTTLASGVSFGGGQTTPAYMSSDGRHAHVIEELRENEAIQRIAGFGSSLLATYAPRVYERMQDALGALYARTPSLEHNFSGSIYPAASFNLGPETVCFPHTDALNDPCNYCHICALGDYDPKTSGHIVLYDSRLVIEFPPGASILILSAVEKHGNTPLAHGETRQSFTQYCAGGLLRWVDAGFRTLKDFAKVDRKGKAAFDNAAEERVKSFLALLSTHEELLAHGCSNSGPSM